MEEKILGRELLNQVSLGLPLFAKINIHSNEPLRGGDRRFPFDS